MIHSFCLCRKQPEECIAKYIELLGVGSGEGVSPRARCWVSVARLWRLSSLPVKTESFLCLLGSKPLSYVCLWSVNVAFRFTVPSLIPLLLILLMACPVEAR